MTLSGRKRLTLASLALLVSASCAKPPTRLEPGTPVAGELTNRGTSYSFRVESGQYFNLSVNKTSTGVGLTIFKPDGRELRTVTCSHDGDLQIDDQGPASGAYTLRLSACAPDSERISYEVRLSIPEAPATGSSERVAAERLAAEAEGLVAQYRADSRKTALLKYQDSLLKWKALGDLRQQSGAYINIAELYRDLGDSTQAANNIQIALSMAHESGATEVESEALLTQATIGLLSGTPDKALEAALGALTIARATANPKTEEAAEYLLGRIHYETANYQKATEALQESLRISQTRGDRLGGAQATLYLAGVDFDQNKWPQARDRGEQALAVFRSFADKKAETWALTYLGHIYSQLNREQAMTLYEEARSLARDSGDFFIEASLLNGLAILHEDLGDNEAAISFFKQAMEKSQELGDRIGVAYTVNYMGEVDFAIGDLPEAMNAFNQSLETFRSLSHTMMEATVLQKMGILYETTGNRTKALDLLNESLKLSRKAQDKRLETWGKVGIAHVQEAAGDIGGALKNYEQALRFWEDTKDAKGQVTALYRIANCLRKDRKSVV